MKVLLFLFLSLNVFAAHIDEFAKEMVFQRNYDQAITLAQKENKPLVMIFSADYCPWCRKFEHRTLKSKSISELLKQKFITLVLDKKYDRETFPKKYITHFTPAVFIIDSHSKETLKETVGYIKKKEFMEVLNSVHKSYTDKK